MELGWWYGIGKETARENFILVRDAFVEKVSPLLFFLQDASTVKANRPKDFAEKFPYILLMGDGTNFRINKPQNFALQTISYSTYKKCNSFQIVICKSHFSMNPNVMIDSPFLVHSPDGRIQCVSLLYGGSSNETSIILNQSMLDKCLRGMFTFDLLSCFINDFSIFAEMGYFDEEVCPESKEIIMYDTAGHRVQLEVKLMCPPRRHDDGNWLKVRRLFFFFFRYF